MNNIQAYNTIAKSKKVSELFLGTLDINWNFAKIGYTAVCTEALPLTFMEKMVCGIANLDGKVSLGDLAHIMGLNIENDVQNLKFQDMGETEILMETLRTLKQFGVIATTDDSFSYVELTDIGREYYTKGRKFKQGETKGFTMYFDVTAGEHAKAKELFSKVTVDGSNDADEELELPYADENFVKKYAEAQIPQYYSEKSGNSFTDMSVSSSEYLYKKVVLGIIYDSFTETYRFVVVDNGGIRADYISEYVNSENNVSRYLGLFFKDLPQTTASKSSSQVEFEETITKVQSDAEYALFNEKPEQALRLVAIYAASPEYMEKQNLFNFIQLKKNEDAVKDVFISLPTLSEDAEGEIRKLAEDGNIRVMLSCSDLEDFDARFGDNVLALNGDVNSGVMLMMDGITYCCENFVFAASGENFCVGFLRKKEEDSDKTMENIRDHYATSFIPNALDKYEDILLVDSEDFDVLERIDVLNGADNIIPFADSYVESTGNMDRLISIRARRDEQLHELVQKYSCNMMDELNRLKANTPLEEIVTLDSMEKAQLAFSDFKGKLIKEQSKDNEKGWEHSGSILALNDSIRLYETQLNNRENYLKQELLPKNYIIDTNVFVYFPEIMDYIGKDDRAILSLKVLEELDKLKVSLSGKAKQNVRKAIKEINYKIRMKSKAFCLESADTRLLPEEFDKTNSDNLILSVALKYSDRNPFLITNDINFQNCAAAIGIPFKGLADLLPEDVYKLVLFGLIERAYKVCAEKNVDVLVAQIVSEIKKTTPSFSLRAFGFVKFKDLCLAFPSNVELYDNNKGALCMRLLTNGTKV